MSSKNKNLSHVGTKNMISVKNERIAIITAEWNEKVTFALRDAAIQTLKKHGAKEKHLFLQHVPGTFELPLAAAWLLEPPSDLRAVICLGCVVRGETPHFDYICQATSQGIMTLNLKYGKPVVFGVLTTDNMAQALDRAGGKYGNKGDEAALTVIKMLGLYDNP